jgi:hypothetical protein
MLRREIQENNGLFRLVRRPAEIIVMPGVNCGQLHRLVRRPAEVEKGQGDAAKRGFLLSAGVCARCARGDLVCGVLKKGRGSIPLEIR